MSVLLELFVFFGYCLSSIFSILDNTYLGDIILLDIICGMMYLVITLDGIFKLLNVNQEGDG